MMGKLPQATVNSNAAMAMMAAAVDARWEFWRKFRHRSSPLWLHSAVRI